mmetsp:Transcript_41846/g.108328  ORF Transcript_41846/g.108328 Transcript_41846/m.108328 type:complete len:248 (-) Transcript_41846:150-893(-)
MGHKHLGLRCDAPTVWSHASAARQCALLHAPSGQVAQVLHQLLQPHRLRHVQVAHQCLQARGVAVQHAAVVSLRAAGPPEALGEILQFCIARPADDVQLIRPQEAAVHQIREDLALCLSPAGPLHIAAVHCVPRRRVEEEAAHVQLPYRVPHERKMCGVPPRPTRLALQVWGRRKAGLRHVGQAVHADGAQGAIERAWWRSWGRRPAVRAAQLTPALTRALHAPGRHSSPRPQHPMLAPPATIQPWY